MSILIRRARAIDPANGLDEVCELFIEGQRVSRVGQFKPPRADRVIDAEGLLALPGLVDAGACLREPGYEFKATIESETRAAAASGITTLCAMPELHPGAAASATVSFIQRRAEAVGFCRVLAVGAMTVGLEGKALSEMASLKQAGCVAVSNGLQPFANVGVLRRALQYASGLDVPVFLYPLDHVLIDGGCAHEGAVATRLGLPGIPASAEIAALGQYLALVEDTGARVHFCRLSCARSIVLIEQARAAGLEVSADVCAHQLFLTEDDVSGLDPDCRLLPPARGSGDRDALRAALAGGGIDVVCSDHQPHDVNAKLAPFPASAPGISSLETFLPLMLELVEEGVVPMAVAVAAVTSNPARLLRSSAGSLRPGAVADVCLVDPAHEWILNEESMLSSGRNTPFSGRRFKGRARWTVLGGRIVHGD